MNQNQFWKNYKTYRDQLCASIPENVGERMSNEKLNTLFKLKTEYNVNLGINEARVGKWDKCEYFSTRVKIISILDNITSKHNKDYFFETLSDFHNSIKNIHYFNDDCEVNLLKIDKMID